MQVSVYLSSATNNYLVPVVSRRTYSTFFTSDIITASRLSLRTLSQLEASSNTSVSVFQKFFRGVTFCWTLCKVGKSLMRLFFQKIPRQQITFRHPWCERTKCNCCASPMVWRVTEKIPALFSRCRCCSHSRWSPSLTNIDYWPRALTFRRDNRRRHLSRNKRRRESRVGYSLDALEGLLMSFILTELCLQGRVNCTQWSL